MVKPGVHPQRINMCQRIDRHAEARQAGIGPMRAAMLHARTTFTSASDGVDESKTERAPTHRGSYIPPVHRLFWIKVEINVVGIWNVNREFAKGWTARLAWRGEVHFLLEVYPPAASK